MMTAAPSTSMTVPAEQMRAMLGGHIVAQSLYAIAALGIADLIAKGHTAIDELAAATGTHSPSLHRMLRTLASLGVLTETAEGEFGLTPLGATLRSDVPDSLRDQALFETSACLWAAWGHLVDSLRSGRPSFALVNKGPLFSYLTEHPELGTVFNSFMTMQSKLQNAAVIASYDFSWAKTVVDVGGGHGATLAAVLAEHPKLRGVLIDLPEVVSNTSVLETSKFTDRCQVVGGSVLDAVTASGDIYMIKRVMMSFSDDDAGTILRNCRAAMRADSRVLVIDPMLPDGTEPHYNRLTDLLMLVVPGGRCRSEAEFRRLFDAAGLSVTQVIATGTSNFILEGIVH
jgi:O-methyltransferase/IclR-like helix-turn-helix domain-containing protein